MLDLILTVFRYILLALLYLFIFQLIKMMFRDLHAGGRSTEKGLNLSPAVPGDLSWVESIPEPGAEAGLVVLASGDQGLPPGTTYSIKPGDEIRLGRGSRNTITLVDPFASMEHAEVYRNGGQYWLLDRGSRNGTFLNEVRINNPTVLADKDSIRIGGVTLQFVRWAYEVESGDRSGFGQETK